MMPLTPATFRQGLTILMDRDADLARVVARHGFPPFWRRKPGFATLVRIILEQQVSLASANAVYGRLTGIVAPFSALRFRQIDGERVKGAGLTRQKMNYCYELAEAIARGHLRLNRLGRLPDEEARQALVQVKGIGPWSADVYLLMALRRPDIWPCGDLALRSALQTVKKLSALPSATTFDAFGMAWRPWRAIAARILWHAYLSKGKPGAKKADGNAGARRENVKGATFGVHTR